MMDQRAKTPFGHTLADRFCENYVRFGGRCSYILLPRLLVDKAMADADRILQPNARRDNLVEFEGTPAYRIRNKLVVALHRHRNNIKALFAALCQMFTEEAIRELFTEPNIWILNHNEQAWRLRTAEINEENRLRKLGKGPSELHRECKRRTANKSTVWALRELRDLRT